MLPGFRPRDLPGYYVIFDVNSALNFGDHIAAYSKATCPATLLSSEVEWAQFGIMNHAIRTALIEQIETFKSKGRVGCWKRSKTAARTKALPPLRHGVDRHTHQAHVYDLTRIAHGFSAYQHHDKARVDLIFMIVNGEFFYEKSHLCGVKTCENWHHVVFESSYLNSQRKYCHSGAKLCRCYPRCLTNPGFIFVPLIPGGNPADPYVPGYWTDPQSVDFNLLFDIYEMVNQSAISPPSLSDIDPRSQACQVFLKGYIDFPVIQEPSPPRGPPTPWPRQAIPCVVNAIAKWHSHHRYRDLRSRVPPLREIEDALKNGAAWSNVLLYSTLRDTLYTQLNCPVLSAKLYEIAQHLE